MAISREHVARLETALRQKFSPHVPAATPAISAVAPINTEADGTQISRSLAVCALSAYCGLEPAIVAPSLIIDAPNLGLDAIHWDENFRRLLFIKSYWNSTDDLGLSRLVFQALASIRALQARNLDAFPIALHKRLRAFLEVARSDNSYWVLMIIAPHQALGESARQELQCLKNDLDCFSWDEVEIDTLSRWLSVPLHINPVIPLNDPVGIPASLSVPLNVNPVTPKPTLRNILRTRFLPVLPKLSMPKTFAPGSFSAWQATQKDDHLFSRALAALALTALCKIDDVTAARATLADRESNGLNAVFFDAPLQRVVFLRARYSPHSESALLTSDEIQQSINLIRSLKSRALADFSLQFWNHLTANPAALATPETPWLLVVAFSSDDLGPFRCKDSASFNPTKQQLFQWQAAGLSTLHHWSLQPAIAPAKPPPEYPKSVALTSDQVHQIRAGRREAQEAERLLEECETPPSAYPLSAHEWPAVEFQMANGNDVRVEVDWFPEQLPSDEKERGVRPGYYYAIRVFSTEDSLSRSLDLHWEERPGKEFSFETLSKVWGWLEALVRSRGHVAYDFTEEFIEDFEDKLTAAQSDEDAVEHLEHLPEIINQEAFDRVDDSIYNDQNDTP